MAMKHQYIFWFDEISIDDVALVGGKNASLGELYRTFEKQQINVPFGFAISSSAYWDVLKDNNLISEVKRIIGGLDRSNLAKFKEGAEAVRKLIVSAPLPRKLSDEVIEAYAQLCRRYGDNTDVAVRSSATAEDLPHASFAGQQESFLNVRGSSELLSTCKQCFASLFTERAISYRLDQGFDHFQVALSIGVQKMVRSDLACSGVSFSIDPESGFRDVVLISAVYGLGETIVQGRANPDEFLVFKPTLKSEFKPIIERHLGSKKLMMVYQEKGTTTIDVPEEKQQLFTLNDVEVLTLARWTMAIEEHYSARAGHPTPMDIEWAKDGQSGELFIVQARPETVISRRDCNNLVQFKLKGTGEVVTRGSAVGQAIAAGKAHVIHTPKDIEQFIEGGILVTETTDPDWEPVMRLAKGVITDRGGRTSHAAIVSRELGIPCVVGTSNATEKLAALIAADQGEITICCAEGEVGNVYRGTLPFERTELKLDEIPQTKTQVMVNVGSPENAFQFSFLPQDGVGLAREEFIVSSHIRVHPMALVKFDQITDPEIRRQIEACTTGYGRNKAQYFVDRLAEGVGKIVAAFYPKPVIVRMSDFKSNEYAELLGGRLFEPQEENPMIGWRGASRYYSEGYKEGFVLECQAMCKVRREFGLTNLKLMIPFCRTVEEGRNVLRVMADNGLKQGVNGLEIYAMCEIPSNVILAEEFLDIFDGFSIGSNDLTQLTLGLDRDSELVAPIFDERNEAVKSLIRSVITVANRKGKYIGICGDAPSTYPDFASFLVECGIHSISLSPDAVVRTRLLIAKEEQRILKTRGAIT